MNQKILLITPPFTQLNTPYPATPYLKGFFNTKGIESFQCDLGIEVILQLFSRKSIIKLFNFVEANSGALSLNASRILSLREEYTNVVDDVISFLQGCNPSLAHLINEGEFLPEASRFQHVDYLDWAFGTMGITDKAKHLATLFLEDLSDFIVETVDPHFGFSRYAESLALSPETFDDLENELKSKNSFIDYILIKLLAEMIVSVNPNLVLLSIPFPGNLYSGLKCGQWIKLNYPDIKIALGGGYANTELRKISDPRIFEYIDFITLDDGESPILNLIEMLDGKRKLEKLKRTFTLVEKEVKYFDGSEKSDIPQKDLGIPDYTDLPLKKYLSVIETVNPMHRLWSDGRWNKLTIAHGCYWGKCTFCDISLDYISRYEPLTAKLLCDRIEAIIEQTGETGFHFVDEAAPPVLMRDLALEIIKRKINISWWTNIRFEKKFTFDLCRLLKKSGCIAVTGGLEVASERILKLIDKGVSIEQVSKVTDNFTRAGIMVHAYLMYGFPTQTIQETIDSLEIVRQMFLNGIIQSAYWHRFAMTVHSPVGIDPEKFHVKIIKDTPGAFANNDLEHIDPEGADHIKFSEGLKKSLYNYMHGIGYDFPLSDWFDFKVPRSTIKPNLIESYMALDESSSLKSNSKIVWLGNSPKVRQYVKNKRGKSIKMTELLIHNNKEDLLLNVRQDVANWLLSLLEQSSISIENEYDYETAISDYEKAGLKNFEHFWLGQAVSSLRKAGLLVL